MISTTTKYKQELIKGNRNYVVKVIMTLADSTQLTLTDSDIWDDGVTINQAISNDNSFDIGSAIIGTLSLTLNNIDGRFNTYDFLDARLTLWLGVTNDVDQNDNQVYYRIGFYVVDEPSYNGSLITLECLDNMTWFDVPFSSVNFPTNANTTAGQLVSAICTYVGVTLGTSTFPNYNRTIYKQSLIDISEKEINCREVLQFVAQKCCCYCKITTAGQLALKWYDKSAINGLVNYDGGTYNTHTTPYSDGDAVDGGDFFNYNTTTYDGGTFTALNNNAWISQNYEINVSTDNIVVTGVRIKSDTGDDDTHYDELWVDSVLEQTHDRYVLVIENNPLILKSEAATIANVVGNILANLPIRGYSASSLSDFSYETGDMATVVDFRGNSYYSWITNFSFTINNAEDFSCGVESVKKRSESRYSQSARTLAEAQKYAEDHLTEYDTAVKAMNDLAASAIGYHKYEATVSGSTVTWLYNGNQRTGTTTNPKFPGSTVVFKISGDGVFISNSIAADGTVTYTNGYDANSGTAILNLIYAIGINCDWIHAGTLKLGGNNNQNGQLQIYNASNTNVGSWTNSGITIKSGAIKMSKNSLTDAYDGLYLGTDGIALGKSSTFKVANTGHVDAKDLDITGGSIKLTKQSISDANNGLYLGTDGIALGKSNVFKVTNTGALTASSGTIGGFKLTSTALHTGDTATESTNTVLSTTNITRSIDGTNRSVRLALGQNFGVSSTGVLYAAGANISGTINASSGSFSGTLTSTNGKIANFEIRTNIISTQENTSSTANGSVTLASADFTRHVNGADRTNLRLAIGSRFGVASDGTVYATDGVFKGSLTSTDASIGNFTIDTNYIRTAGTTSTADGSVCIGSANFTRWLNGANRTSLRLAIGSRFGVANDGTLYATAGVFKGDITGASGTFSGTVSGGDININSGRFKVTDTGRVSILTQGTSSQDDYLVIKDPSNKETYIGGEYIYSTGAQESVRIADLINYYIAHR